MSGTPQARDIRQSVHLIGSTSFEAAGFFSGIGGGGEDICAAGILQDGVMRKLVRAETDSRVGFSAEGVKIIVMELLDTDRFSKGSIMG